MPRRKPAPKSDAPAVATGDAVVLPAKRRRKSVDAGVARPARAGARRVTASIAASVDLRFPKGSASFAVWCQRKGVDAQERRTAEQWDDLLSEFARRPIHGHRRSTGGGTHKRG